MSRLVPAVTIDVTDDGTAYTVTAYPWPTIDAEAHPYIARLSHRRWDDVKLAKFLRTLMATYPKARA